MNLHPKDQRPGTIGDGATSDASPARAEKLHGELDRLRARHERSLAYIREKTNQLLGVMGTIPLRPEELDDESLVEMDPIGIISDAFAQVVQHLHDTNDELQTTHDELQAIFDTAEVGIVVLDPDQQILSYNATARRHLLHNNPHATGEKCFDAMCRKVAPLEHLCTFHRAVAAGTTHRRKNWVQGNRHYDVVATPIYGSDGALRQVVLVYLDITERLQTLEALAESEARYRDLFENANDLIQSVGPDGTFLYVNRAWRETLGYTDDEVRTLNVFEILAPTCVDHCQQLFRRLMDGEDVGRIDVTYLTKNGKPVELEGNVNVERVEGRPTSTRGIFREVTEQRQVERENQRNQRLESVGQLAAGIAHDFNNLLTAILNNVTLARLAEPGSDLFRNRLEDSERAVLRASDLTRQLLTFAKGGDPIRRQISLPRLVADATGFALAGSSHQHEFSTAPDTWAVEADPGQLNQVIQNLVLNATQASGPGATVRVRCFNHLLDLDDGFPLPKGPYAVVEVQDDGDGISPEHLPQIFDPYFTTKPDGSGLGLATAHAVVRKHGGHIAVESSPGAGATFRVYLPATGVPGAEESESRGLSRGKGRVLVMDDEEFIREATSDLLDMLGYRCDAAADGATALERYRQAMEAGDPFDVVIMDLTIPGGMGGKEAVGELLTLDPTARAVVSSGYCNDPVMADHARYGFRAVAPKPYRAELLAKILEELTALPRD